MNPTVSVLMAVYNAQEHLREAIESVLGQTFNNLELIVVDDGSQDGTWQILRSYDDPRIHPIREVHRGLESSLNIGIECSRGEFIARMDADDVSLPQRIERQVRFFEQNPEVVLLGSFCRRIDELGRDLGIFTVPSSSRAIQQHMFRDNPFVHSTVMFRRRTLSTVGCYDPAYRHGDYDLWVRMAAAFPVVNLPEVLVVRREHSESMSRAISGRKSRWERLRLQWKAARTLPWSISSACYLALGLAGCASAAVRGR